MGSAILDTKIPAVKKIAISRVLDESLSFMPMGVSLMMRLANMKGSGSSR